MEWLGYASAILHLFVTTTFLVLIIVSHTLYHNIWLKILIFTLLAILFIQHIMLGGCVMTMFEKKVSQQTESPFRDLLQKIFKTIGITMEQYDLYFLPVIATSLVWMTLEIVSDMLS